MTDPRLLELLDKYVENRLREDERVELSARLAASPADCRAFWDYIQQHALLAELMAERVGFRLAYKESAVQPRHREPALPWGALAAVLVFAIGLSWLLWPLGQSSADAPVVLAELRGQVHYRFGDERFPALPGQPLRVGTEIETGDGSSVVVRYADSSRLELTADTAIRLLDEAGVFLLRGMVNAEIAQRPQSRPMKFQTEHGEVLAIGARFQSASLLGETRIEMEAGKARLASGGASMELLSGSYALVSSPVPEAYLTAPRLPVSKNPAHVLDEPSGPVVDLAISPDGKYLAYPCHNGVVRLLELANPQKTQLFASPEGRPQSVSFSPEGGHLLVGYEVGRRIPTGPKVGYPLTIFEVKTGAVVQQFPQAKRAASVGYFPDGQTIAYISNERQNKGVNLWDLGDARERLRLIDRADRLSCLAIHPLGDLVAAGAAGGQLYLADPRSGRTTHTLQAHTRDLQALEFSPDGLLLATGGRDGAIHLWDATTSQHLRTLSGKFGEVRCLAFSPDGRTLASGHGGTVALWDIETGQKRSTLSAHRFAVSALAYLPDGNTLLTAGWDRSIKWWPLEPIEEQ